MSQLRNAVGQEDHVQGGEDAACTIVEYGDYQCPHCATAHPVVKKLQRHFGDKLRFVFRNFPLTQIHPEAEPAAEAAEFAGSQGKFWEMHDALFENQENLGQELYEELAGELGLEAKELDRALGNGTFTDRVRADFSGGVRSGVNGTPTFFIQGQRHNGSFDYERLAEAIEEVIPS